MKQIRVIGVPLDLGAGRRGVDMGPSAMRIARLNQRLVELGHDPVDTGDIAVAIQETHPEGDQRARYLPQIVDVCSALSQRVDHIMEDGAFPLVLGGDHSVAIGTIAGVATHFHRCGERTGVIWVDAHSDMNTPETSPSGNIHGMPLAVTLGYGAPELVTINGIYPKIRAQDAVLIGVRSIDPTEKRLVIESGMTIFTMRDVDERGMRSVIQEAIHLVTRDTNGLHVSFDMDSLDPSIAPGVGTPVNGGLTYREAHLLMECVSDSGKLTSLEVVEINPIIDIGNVTAEVAVGLLLSALGKKIL